MSRHLHERGPAEIEREIHETQSGMDKTIEALRARLSPRELFGQSLGYIRHSGADVGQNLMSQIRSNPLPAVLLAASLGWLMTSAGRKRQADAGTAGQFAPSGEAFPQSDDRTMTQYGKVFRALAGVRPRIDESGHEFGNRLYPAIAQALEMRQEPSETPEMFRMRIESAIDDLSSRAQHAQHNLSVRAQEQWRRTREGAQHVADAAGEQIRHVTHQAGDLYSQYPLIAGGIALALGALLGAAIPATRQEKDLFGGAGEELRRTAGEAVRAAGDVAGRAAHAAREGAQRGQADEWPEAAREDFERGGPGRTR